MDKITGMASYIQTLNAYGFTAVSLPRQGITPLSIFTGDEGKGYKFIGTLSEFYKEGSSNLPKITTDQDVIAFKTVSTGKFNSKIGLDFLDGFFSQFADIGMKIKIFFNKADKLEIRFENVKYDSVSPNDIFKYVVSSTPAEESLLKDSLRRYEEAYVVIETLKSNNINIGAYDEKGMGADIGFDAMKNLASGSGSIEKIDTRDNSMLTQGKNYLTFGVKAWQLALKRINFPDKGPGEVLADDPSKELFELNTKIGPVDFGGFIDINKEDEYL